MTTRRQMLGFLAALPALKLVGCGNAEDTVALDCDPLMLTPDHDCALCGMTIVNFPGPKGQACLRDGRILPFCSISDLLSWSWQPESRVSIETLWVHDLSATTWSEPDDAHYIAASDAWYVVGHDQRGAMGHTPAPFSLKSDAEQFAADHGGKLYRLDELDFDNFRGPQQNEGHGHHHGHS